MDARGEASAKDSGGGARARRLQGSERRRGQGRGGRYRQGMTGAPGKRQQAAEERATGEAQRAAAVSVQQVVVRQGSATEAGATWCGDGASS